MLFLLSVALLFPLLVLSLPLLAPSSSSLLPTPCLADPLSRQACNHRKQCSAAATGHAFEHFATLLVFELNGAQPAGCDAPTDNAGAAAPSLDWDLQAHRDCALLYQVTDIDQATAPFLMDFPRNTQRQRD